MLKFLEIVGFVVGATVALYLLNYAVWGLATLWRLYRLRRM
jgi:uncharacterized membrane protein YuzA (DUF378 family)